MSAIINVVLSIVLVVLVIVSYILYRRYHQGVLQASANLKSKEMSVERSQGDTQAHKSSSIHEHFYKHVENPFEKGLVKIKVENPLFFGMEFGVGFMLVATLFFLLIYLSYRLFF